MQIKLILMIDWNASDCLTVWDKRRTFNVYVPLTFDGRELRFQLFLLMKNANSWDTIYLSPPLSSTSVVIVSPQPPSPPKNLFFRATLVPGPPRQAFSRNKRGAGVKRWGGGSYLLQTCHADWVILKRVCLWSCRILDTAIRLMVLLFQMLRRWDTFDAYDCL